ncbi:hypothetical protein VIGAN_08175400, partial [Vigna angularis var. angularis]
LARKNTREQTIHLFSQISLVILSSPNRSGNANRSLKSLPTKSASVYSLQVHSLITHSLFHLSMVFLDSTL